MPLTPGSRLGPYAIVSAIGAGGMGEVYKATDTRLDRTVAIKVLPQADTDDPDRRQRFDREARAVAALSHPNICALFDVGRLRVSGASASQGHGDEVSFLVMEYLEGETLAERIARSGGRSGSGSRTVDTPARPVSDRTPDGGSPRPAGRPLPVAETIRIATALADALAAAHNAGIVHRDLKPGNVMLTRSGVKVLDFGLAKALGQDGEDHGAGATMTATTPLTGVGSLLGTMPYMSPEQVEGREADARSDIFALGAVIYEMATGRRAFDAPSQAGLIAAILERQPEPMSVVEPITPPALERIATTCLEKDPDERWQDASDIARQLRWLAADSGSQVRSGETASAGTEPSGTGLVWPALEPKRIGKVSWPVAAIAIAGIASVALISVWGLERQTAGVVADAAPVHFAVGVPGASINDASLSPDGRTLALVGVDDRGQAHLWLRRLDSTAATEVTGADGIGSSTEPLWSPDGTELSVMTARGRVIIEVDGGLARVAAPRDARGRVGDWTSDGVILSGGADGIWSLDVASGTLAELVTGVALHPHGIAGRRFLFSAPNEPAGATNPESIFVASLDAPAERRRVVDAASTSAVDAGHLLFVRDGTLFAQPFDEDTAEVSGDPQAIVDGVFHFKPNGASDFRAAAGNIVYRTPSPDVAPSWYTREGTESELTAPGLFDEVAISPDGSRLVIYQSDRRTGTGDLWLFDMAGGTPRRLTRDTASEANFYWSPDGRRIAYGSDITGPPDVFVLDVDSGTSPTRVFATAGVDYPLAWLSDDRVLVRTSDQAGSGFRVVSATGEVIDPDPAGASSNTVLSPDGQWGAFTSSETGRDEVYVRTYGRASAVVAVSRDGGSLPVWSRDGRTLYFARRDAIFESRLTLGTVPSAEAPRQLFAVGQDIHDFDVTPDGQRFLVLKDPPSDFQPFRVLVNWPALLRR